MLEMWLGLAQKQYKSQRNNLNNEAEGARTLNLRIDSPIITP